MKLTDRKIAETLVNGLPIAREGWKDKNLILAMRNNKFYTNLDKEYSLSADDLYATDWYIKENGTKELTFVEALNAIFNSEKYNKIFRKKWTTYLYLGQKGRLRWEDGMTYTINAKDFNATDWVAVYNKTNNQTNKFEF